MERRVNREQEKDRERVYSERSICGVHVCEREIEKRRGREKKRRRRRERRG